LCISTPKKAQAAGLLKSLLHVAILLSTISFLIATTA